MKYGAQYRVVELNDGAMGTVRRTLNSENLDWKDSLTYQSAEAKKHSSRISQQAWIKDDRFCQMFCEIAQAMNLDSGWNLNIQGVEPIQFGIYPEGGKYDWHVDQHPHLVQGTVRKISMSLFLNDPSEYEGGEFDLEIYKPESDCRYETFRLSKGSAIFFPSDMWHRVRPVTSGVRKSIVAWFYGPPYT